ncbi:MAG: hypothetical protein IJS69_00015 [Selenomonadaceae bacterium]|nr:hypothetical protein [Selenomonadaceae bacterium]
MIHICFGLHDKSGRYSKFVGASMASIFENTSAPVTIHILHDATLTDENRDNFSYLAGRYGQYVKFHHVEKICAEEVAFLRDKLADKIRLRFSIGAFYRLIMKKILAPYKIGKAIYLDADIIVNLDIDEMWRHDLKNFSLGAVPEVQATLGYMIANKYLLHENLVEQENYFNSGVIIFNLDALSENFFYDGVQFLIDHPKCESPDQDILNAFFSANYLKLDQKFDSFVLADQRRKFPVAKKIYHYAGRCLELKLYEPYNRLFMEYFSRTPWFNVEAFGRVGEAFRNSNDSHNLVVQRVMKHCLDHSRAFFVSPANLDAVKLIYDIRNDEEIIINNGPESINDLVAKMNEQRGQKLFFICQMNYDYMHLELMRRGFREFHDYLNGMSFLTRNQCGYTRPEWSLISDM